MKQSNTIRRGFSLIELVIVVVIIAIIAAIAVPKMSRGAAGANDAATMQNLAQMRSAIDLFITEHGGALPSSTPSILIQQLTEYSDTLGANFSTTKTSSCYFGPYLKSIPTLPVGTNKGSSAITSTGTVGTGSAGWFYDSVTQTIKVNNPSSDVDAKGTAYNTY